MELSRNIIHVLNFLLATNQTNVSQSTIDFAKQVCPDLEVPNELYEAWNCNNVSNQYMANQINELIGGQF